MDGKLSLKGVRLGQVSHLNFGGHQPYSSSSSSSSSSSIRSGRVEFKKYQKDPSFRCLNKQFFRCLDVVGYTARSIFDDSTAQKYCKKDLEAASQQ